MVTVWKGTDAELNRLRQAVDDTCEHSKKCQGVPAALVCPAHRMLAEQRTLDLFLGGWRSRDYWVTQEWGPCAAPLDEP